MRFSLAALLLTGLAFTAAATPAAPLPIRLHTPAPVRAPTAGLAPLAAQMHKHQLLRPIGQEQNPQPAAHSGAVLSSRNGLRLRPGRIAERPVFGRYPHPAFQRPRAVLDHHQKGQSLIQLVHSVYTPGEKFYLNGEISAYDILLYYYGKGPNSPVPTSRKRSTSCSSSTSVCKSRFYRSCFLVRSIASPTSRTCTGHPKPRMAMPIASSTTNRA